MGVVKCFPFTIDIIDLLPEDIAEYRMIRASILIRDFTSMLTSSNTILCTDKGAYGAPCTLPNLPGFPSANP
jgi:hypothetical protein